MRLSQQEINVLKDSLYKLSKEAKLYLFGSRVDDSKRGGDIDLLVVSNTLNKRKLRELKFNFFDNFGEQKIDIILDDGSFNDIFNKMIFQKAIQL